LAGGLEATERGGFSIAEGAVRVNLKIAPGISRGKINPSMRSTHLRFLPIMWYSHQWEFLFVDGDYPHFTNKKGRTLRQGGDQGAHPISLVIVVSGPTLIYSATSCIFNLIMDRRKSNSLKFKFF
jgi:hypothetical protein